MKALFILLLGICILHADAIKPESKIVITIKGIPPSDASINDTYEVYSNGNINMPYIKTVKAAGKTPEQLAKYIENRYKSEEIFTNPTVNVANPNAEAADTKIFTLITDAGSRIVDYRKNMTLQTAIAAGGGGRTFDSKRYVEVERKGATKEYDMENSKDRNIKIFPDDVIRLKHVNAGILDKLLGR